MKQLALLLLPLCLACGNKTNEAESAQSSDQQSELNFVETDGEEVQQPSGYVSNWKKKYFTDEFGDENHSLPFIEQGWDGQRNNHFDCRMLIRISNVYGLQFGIMEDYNMAELGGLTITAQFNGQKFQIPYDDVTNGAVTITDMNVIKDFIGILDSEGMLKLSFYREDSFGAPQNRVFSINTPTNVKQALAGIGIEVGYNGKYDYQGDSPAEDESFDPTTLDEETLMNRVIEE
jgi:hypothetical protein